MDALWHRTRHGLALRAVAASHAIPTGGNRSRAPHRNDNKKKNHIKVYSLHSTFRLGIRDYRRWPSSLARFACLVGYWIYYTGFSALGAIKTKHFSSCWRLWKRFVFSLAVSAAHTHFARFTYFVRFSPYCWFVRCVCLHRRPSECVCNANLVCRARHLYANKLCLHFACRVELITPPVVTHTRCRAFRIRLICTMRFPYGLHIVLQPQIKCEIEFALHGDTRCD